MTGSHHRGSATEAVPLVEGLAAVNEKAAESGRRHSLSPAALPVASVDAMAASNPLPAQASAPWGPRPPGAAAPPRLSRRRLLLIGVLIGLLVSLIFGLIPRQLKLAEAEMIGDRVMASWQKRSGVPPWYMGRRETRVWADGWEMRWRYRPCAAMASLRVVISQDGRSVRVTEYPDCAPGPGAQALTV